MWTVYGIAKWAIALAINHGVGYIYIFPHSDPKVVGIFHYRGLDTLGFWILMLPMCSHQVPIEFSMCS
jgi:hypothetical protein